MFQYCSFMAFVGHIWQSKEELPLKIPVEKSKFALLMFAGILAAAPFVKLISLIFFIYNWIYTDNLTQAHNKPLDIQ